MTSFDAIVKRWQERRSNTSAIRQRAIQVRDQYNGDIVLPVLNKSDVPLTVNIVKQGADTLARRITSTQPNVMFPAEKPGTQSSENHASDQRQAICGFWDQNKMKLKDRRRARHLIVYGSTPVTVRPVPIRSTFPIWDVRDPLTTYPSPDNDPDNIVPEDCIFEYKRPYSWIARTYPDKINSEVFRPRGKAIDPDQQFTILEFINAEEIVVGVVGTVPGSLFNSAADIMGTNSINFTNGAQGGGYGELDRIVNRTGMPLTVVPRRITLDKTMGQFDGQLGMFIRQAEMMALTHEALKRGIVPSLWVVGHPGEIPTIHSTPDPDNGDLGQLSGGQIVPIQPNPSFMAPQMIDRLDEYQRQEVGSPMEFGGQTSSNAARTGVRGQQLMQGVVDFPVQEYQEVLEMARMEEDKIAIAIEKTYWGNKAKSVYVGWDSARGRLDYTPNKLWTSDDHVVSYAYAGTDTNNLAVAAGQRNAMGALSVQSFMEMDPMVEDPQSELARVQRERLDKIIESGFEQQLMAGAIPISDGASVAQKVATRSMTYVDAILEVQKEAQQRQATSGPPGTPEAPVPPGSPEAQPGLAQPGQGAEAGIQGPSPDLSNLQDLLHAYRSTSLGGGQK